MAKTYSQIIMDFQIATQMSDRLKQLSIELKRTANDRFNGTLYEIRHNWKGENADAYLKKGEQLRQKMEDTANDLSKASETVRTIARNTYQAEMRAWRIAQTRTKG